MDPKEIVLSLAVGFAAGLLFAAFRLPVPAPHALAGVAGIFGIFLGYRLFEAIKGLF